jgi:Flp pilus assembly protein TadB
VIASAALVVVGILLERRAESGTQHSVGSTTAQHHENHHDESAEESHVDTAPPASESGSEVSKHHTGIGVESPRIVALGTVAAIALAVAVWRRPSRPVLLAVLVFTAAAAVLDVLEIKHQVGEGRVWHCWQRSSWRFGSGRSGAAAISTAQARRRRDSLEL